MKVLSLFSGIGPFELALKRIGIDTELVGFSEIDKYATKSYCAIHGVDESLNLGDISKINLPKLKTLGSVDLITHRSPYQGFSITNRLVGDGNGFNTRSSLMWYTLSIIKVAHPKYVIWENVKNLLSSKNKHNFDSYLKIMDKLGYNNYYKMLNSKHYGIPQNRERVFTVSIRKDIDTGYEFPKEIELTKKLKDVLEKNVDEKYYLSDELIAGLTTNTEQQKEKGDRLPKIITYDVTQKVKVRKYPVDVDELREVLRESKAKVKITNIKLAEKLGIPKTRVEHYFRQDECFAIPNPKIWHELKKLLKIDTDKFDKSMMTFEEKDGVFTKADRVYDEQGLSPTLTSQENIVVVVREESDEQKLEVNRPHVRKLTPKEYWRLMGFNDEEFDKARGTGISNTQLYKQAGNSITVKVLEAIFKEIK